MILTRVDNNNDKPAKHHYSKNIAGNIVYKLPGHLGSVNDVDFHSVEPIILSCGSDKQIYLGEFEP